MNKKTIDNIKLNLAINPPKTKPITRYLPRIGRNEECPCGSKKKYKKCCWKLTEEYKGVL